MTRLQDALFLSGVAMAVTGGCGIVSGIDDYEVVDCPSGRCSDAAFDSSDSNTDAASDTSDADSPLDCPSGTTQVTVQVASNVSVAVEIGSLKVEPGQTKAVCLERGSKPRMHTSDDSTEVTFAGVDCQEDQHDRRCEFLVGDSSVVVTVSP